MFELNNKEVREILVNEYGYEPFQADILLENFPKIYDELAPAVTRWLKDRTIIDIPLQGITISDVMKNRNYHFLLAIQDLNILFNKDISIEEKSQLIEILQQPVEYW